MSRMAKALGEELKDAYPMADDREEECAGHISISLFRVPVNPNLVQTPKWVKFIAVP